MQSQKQQQIRKTSNREGHQSQILSAISSVFKVFAQGIITFKHS